MIKKKTKTKSRSKNNKPLTLEMPELYFHVPLTGEVWIGHDGAKWIDVALDASGKSAITFVRRKMSGRGSSKYYLVVSVVRAHVLAYEITLAEAVELYSALPNRAPYDKAFDLEKIEEKQLTLKQQCL
jgi:hypothetical protein